MTTLLLVDDDACFRQMVGAVVAGRGHELLEAGRCEDGERLIRDGKPELLIVDGLLPDGDGAAWVGRLRASGVKLPVLFVSAFRNAARDPSRLQRDFGIESFLAKPTTPGLLLARIEKMLQDRVHAAAPDAVLGPDELQALEEMRRDYAARLPAVVQGIQAALEQLRSTPHDPAAQSAARRRAHDVAGTAGSFGFDALGDLCAAIEEAIASLQSGIDFALVAPLLQNLQLGVGAA